MASGGAARAARRRVVSRCAARAVTALLALCCTAAAHSSATSLRTQLVSGSPQDAHAYASTSASAYETDFPKPLVVRVAGAKPGTTPHVRFSCTAPACKLYALDAPDDFKRIDPRAFEIEAKNGVASVDVSLTTTELGTYTVVAEAATDETSERAKRVTFRLTAR